MSDAPAFGRRPSADPTPAPTMAEPLKGSRKTWAESQLAGITAASPASVCTGHSGRAWLANVPWLKA